MTQRLRRNSTCPSRPSKRARSRCKTQQHLGIPRGIASICNDERARFGGLRGHGGLVLDLSERRMLVGERAEAGVEL
ncbi:MAG: hypothetical protein LBE22_01155, partial [Azoarcus sp.]|nr:hypothetical protein [Azoarcus sp.]